MALHEADAAALPCGVQHAIGRGLEAFVCIRDHQLDTTQAASRQAAQEVVPEGLGLAGIDRHAEHFTAAVAVHADAMMTATDIIDAACRRAGRLPE